MQSNPEVSSIKSFVGIQLKRNWLNACHVRFSSNVGLSYNVWFRDILGGRVPYLMYLSVGV